MVMKKTLLLILLCSVLLLCGCAREKNATTDHATPSPTNPAVQTQPEGPLLPPQTQPGGPLFLPELPTIPTLPDTVPPIVVPTVPVLPNPEPEDK